MSSVTGEQTVSVGTQTGDLTDSELGMIFPAPHGMFRRHVLTLWRAFLTRIAAQDRYSVHQWANIM
eukprot:6204952-Pleurochrysis_carterae.AAC.6